MMKPKLVLLVGVIAIFLGGPTQISAATADLSLVNESVRIHPGICSCGLGLNFTMYCSTYWTEQPAYANGEVAPLPQPASFNHWTYFILEDVSLFASTFYAELDLPLADADGNGIADFYEVAHPVSASTSGTYPDLWGMGMGQLVLNWNRAAGSRYGSLQLHMNDSILGWLGPFNHTFELVEFSGQLDYTPGTNVVTGAIQLVKSGSPGETWSGPVSLNKAGTNRFNQLTLVSGVWTNDFDTFAFDNCELIRDSGHPNLYRGRLQNPFGNWRSWQISIVDNNDANGNGIPDLSDDPALALPPRRPALSLAHDGTDLLLTVSGDMGRTNLVQQATSLDSSGWANIFSFVPTNDPQTVVLPLPASNPAYWRVQVP